MRALVTGGAGFIGLALAGELAERGATVDRADIRPPVHPSDRDHRADLGSWAETMRLVKDTRPDVIFHTAALLSAAAEAAPPAGYQANAAATLHLLEAAVLFEVPRVVFLSSIASYGPGTPPEVDEAVPQRPVTMYGVCKVFGELLGEYYGLRFGLDFRAGRYPSVIGPGRGTGGASAYSSAMIDEAAHARPYQVPVPPETVMPLLYVDDAVRSLVELAETPAARLSRRTYGIGGFSPSAGEIADAVRRHVPGADLRFEPDAETTAIVRSWPRELSGRAAHDDWGWAPRFDLDATLAAFVAAAKRSTLP